MILAFTSLFATLSSYFNNMATFCLPQNCIFDISNFTRAYIAQLVERFHGKEEVACSIHPVGTMIFDRYLTRQLENNPRFIIDPDITSSCSKIIID